MEWIVGIGIVGFIVGLFLLVVVEEMPAMKAIGTLIAAVIVYGVVGIIAFGIMDGLNWGSNCGPGCN